VKRLSVWQMAAAVAFAAATAFVIYACGSTSSGSSSATSFSIGGTITNLTASNMVLYDNGADPFTVASGATTFTMPSKVSTGQAYAVTVYSQPSGLTCTVTNGSGIVASANVTNIAIACSAGVSGDFTIGGSITGLGSATGLSLYDNGGDTLTIPANASSFTFATSIATSDTYAVTVYTQPTGLTCSASNGSGTVGTANVTSVSINCASSSAGTYTLTFNGTGFTPHVGQLLGVALINKTTGAVVQTQSVSSLPNSANFSFTFAGALTAGATYVVEYFADENMNGVCDLAPNDHVWRITSTSVDSNWTGQAGLANVSGDVTLAAVHDTNFNDLQFGCANLSAVGAYSLTVNGTNYLPHVGQLFGMSLVDSRGGVVATKTIASIAGSGAYTFSFPNSLVAGATYTIESFADENTNGKCDATPTDHGWHIAGTSIDSNWTGQTGLGSVSGDVTVATVHDTNFVGASCATFANVGKYSLTFSTNGIYPFSAQAGDLFEVALVDSSGVVKAQAVATIPSSGVVSFSFPNMLVPGTTYSVDYFIDANKNGACDAPTTDPVWHITSTSSDLYLTGQAGLASVAANVALSVGTNTNYAPTVSACTNL
jgi:hypothetical protein